MKLLYCLECGDIFNLMLSQVKKCSCGNTKGVYTDQSHAIYSGDKAATMGLSNPSMLSSLRYWKGTGGNADFTAFFIERNCPTFTQVVDVETNPVPVKEAKNGL